MLRLGIGGGQNPWAMSRPRAPFLGVPKIPAAGEPMGGPRAPLWGGAALVNFLGAPSPFPNLGGAGSPFLWGPQSPFACGRGGPPLATKPGGKGAPPRPGCHMRGRVRRLRRPSHPRWGGRDQKGSCLPLPTAASSLGPGGTCGSPGVIEPICRRGAKGGPREKKRGARA